jgi:hypothetical protein
MADPGKKFTDAAQKMYSPENLKTMSKMNAKAMGISGIGFVIIGGAFLWKRHHDNKKEAEKLPKLIAD